MAGCTAPLVRCDRQCVDVTTDVQNCGECGHACLDGEACAAGACAATCLAPVPGHADGTEGLQTAIQNEPGDSLLLCAGTWSLTTNVAITKSFSLIGAGAGRTVLDGNDQTHILTTSPATDVHAADMTFRRGFSDIFTYLGGAITNAGRLTLTDCELTTNNGDVGGAIYSDGPSGAELLTVTGCTFTGNRSPGGGGAISIVETSLTMGNCVLSGNDSDTFGGGVHVSNVMQASGASAQLTDVTFRNNHAASSGGALHVFDATVTLTKSCSITGNTAPLGGAIAIDRFFADSLVTLESGITITGNTPPECTGATIIDPSGACNAP